jgi:hypothetical protein
MVATLLLLSLSGHPSGAATTADGTPRYTPPTRVLPAGLAGPLTATADGSVWGVARLPERGYPAAGRMVLLHRSPGGTWSRRTLPWSGVPQAVADDGRTTFLLFSSHLCSEMDPCRVQLAGVPHRGQPSPPRTLGMTEGVGGSSLVARDGRWWAVWTESFAVRAPDGPRIGAVSRVVQARTMLPAFGPRPVTPADAYVAGLALRGSTGLLALTTDRGLELWAASPAGDFAPTGSSFDASWGDITVAGLRTFIATEREGRLTLAQDRGDLVFSRRVVPTHGAVQGGVSVAASGGRVYLGYDACTRTSGGAMSCRGYVSEAGLAGPVRTTDVTEPLRLSADVWGGVTGLTAVRGKATVTISTQASQAVYARTRR